MASVSRSMDALHPAIRSRAEKALETWDREGHDILVTCTYRDHEAQVDLYARGRTKPGPIVTMAKPGNSKHNHTIDGKPAALAFDVVPMFAGKPVWSTVGDGLLLWREVGRIGIACGLQWAGQWRGALREFPHFQ
jgi:peptidoglycan LD-endopeptidase CwlK